MEIKGKIIQMLPLKSGEGKNGPWQKQDFILETDDQYPKKVCISVWGDKVEQFRLAEGEEVEVSINIESREFNERWYTDIKAWKVERIGQGQGVPQNDDVPLPDIGDEPMDDLPF